LEGPSSEVWFYKEWVHEIFRPFTFADEAIGFAVFYAIGVSIWLYFASKSIAAGVLVSYPLLMGLEAGNITPVLAFACLWFPGAILATLVKPYCIAFVVVHAVVGYYRYHARTFGLPWRTSFGLAQKGQSGVSGRPSDGA
jgi:hypothetical protein